MTLLRGWPHEGAIWQRRLQPCTWSSRCAALKASRSPGPRRPCLHTLDPVPDSIGAGDIDMAEQTPSDGSDSQTRLNDVLDRLWFMKYRRDDAVHIMFAPARQKQDGTLSAVVPAWTVWKAEPLHHKLRSILSGEWRPLTATLRQTGVEALLEDQLGGNQDLGPDLLRLVWLHNHRRWMRAALTKQDSERADGLVHFTLLTNVRYRRFGGSYPPLNLQLGERWPVLRMLLYIISVRVPVESIRYFVQVSPKCVFDAVRRTLHPNSEEIISYLYEILFIQQKTAVALFDFLTLASEIRRSKQDAVLVREELDQVLRADLLVMYLKSTLEKAIALVAAIRMVPGLDNRRRHMARVQAIEKALSPVPEHAYYIELFLDMIRSDNFSEIDRLRSGIVHKRGVANLQPHSYAGVTPTDLPDLELYSKLHEQHAKNSAVVLAALAMLTDDLVGRDPVPQADEVQRLLYDLMQAPEIPGSFGVWSPSQETGCPSSYDPKPGVHRRSHTMDAC
jgi:hypothetical protein